MLYPLLFAPQFRQYIWGGRRLGTLLEKPIGEGEDYAESWEVVDHHDDQSVVENGPLAGTTLRTMCDEHSVALFGRHAPQRQFPLLMKYLDANRNLSVQVHPNDAQGAMLPKPDLGKTEAWIVVHADPGSRIYAGLKRGFDRAAFEREVVRGTTELCLHQIEPAAGDCVFIPAGTVHALGEGLVVAEIQQASDTTFRIFDWNRLGADGQPRQLHIQEALDVIDFETGPIEVQSPEAIESDHVQRLVKCDKFVLDRASTGESCRAAGDDRFHILSVLDGSLQIQSEWTPDPLKKGQTILVPAEVGEVELTPCPHATWLDAYLP